jgi:hypothetical protein
MKRIVFEGKNTGISLIKLELEEREELKKKLMTALKKFGSSRKTKAVHKLINSDLIYPAIFGGQGSEELAASRVSNNNAIKAIFMNIYQYDDSLAGNGTVNLGTRINDFDDKIRSEETYVDEKKLLKIEKLKEQREETVDKFLKSLDYMKMVDGIYFAWLVFLARIAVKDESRTKAKIVTVGSDILADILKNMYQKTKPGKMDPDVHQLIEAIAIYFIRIYFYGESSTYALNLLKQAFSEDTVEAIKRAKVTKINEFNDVAKLLRETELMPITENVFDSLMNRMFGKFAYEKYIQQSLVDYLAFMANLTHNTLLFKDSYPINEDLHKRLEELLLNEQKKAVIAKPNY